MVLLTSQQQSTLSLLMHVVRMSLHLPLCLTSQYSVKTAKHIIIFLSQSPLFQNRIGVDGFSLVVHGWSLSQSWSLSHIPWSRPQSQT